MLHDARMSALPAQAICELLIATIRIVSKGSAMNVLKSFLIAPVAAFVGGSLHAACVDRGYSSFVENAHVVELCENSKCSIARLIRHCSNIHYLAEEYEIGLEIWLFRVRNSSSETGKIEEFALEVRPADPTGIPLTMVDGRPTRLLVGVPIEQSRLEQVSCVPVSDAHACSFAERILAGLN